MLETTMKEIRSEILESLIGTSLPIHLETEYNGLIDGYTPNYIKTIMSLEHCSAKSGDIVTTEIVGTCIDSDGTRCLKGRI